MCVREKTRTVELRDALAVEAIGKKKEVTMNPSSLGVMWKKLARPRPENADRGGKSPTSFLQKMLDSDPWIKRRTTKTGIHCYFPVVRCGEGGSKQYTRSDDGSDCSYPERLNRQALVKYAACEARWGGGPSCEIMLLCLRYIFSYRAVKVSLMLSGSFAMGGRVSAVCIFVTTSCSWCAHSP